MKLKFFAKKDLLVTLPQQVILRGNADTGARGAPVRYVGREHITAVLEKRGSELAVVEAARNPAVPEAFECEADSDMGRRLVKIVRRDQCLWPADLETAEACGIKFVETKFVDGEHVEAKPMPVLDRNGVVKSCSPVGTPGKKWSEQQQVEKSDSADKAEKPGNPGKPGK